MHVCVYMEGVFLERFSHSDILLSQYLVNWMPIFVVYPGSFIMFLFCTFLKFRVSETIGDICSKIGATVVKMNMFFPFLMLRIETFKDERNLEDSVAQ